LQPRGGAIATCIAHFRDEECLVGYAASGGHPRKLSVWTEGNLVEPYIEAQRMWARLWDEISAMGPGGRLWDTSWLAGPLFQAPPSTTDSPRVTGVW
jgi:hypothetical protein